MVAIVWTIAAAAAAAEAAACRSHQPASHQLQPKPHLAGVLTWTEKPCREKIQQSGSDSCNVKSLGPCLAKTQQGGTVFYKGKRCCPWLPRTWTLGLSSRWTEPKDRFLCCTPANYERNYERYYERYSDR